MTCHGFGTGKILSKPLTRARKREIARAISTLDEVLWVHMIHRATWFPGIEIPEDMLPDIIFEMKEDCVQEIKQKVHEFTNGVHKIEIHVVITFEKISFIGGEDGTHPPMLGSPHSST